MMSNGSAVDAADVAIAVVTESGQTSEVFLINTYVVIVLEEN